MYQLIIFYFQHRSHGRKTSKDSSHRHSSVLRRLSFMRQPSEQDELHLLEEAELGELDEDTGRFRNERRRKTSVAEMKKKRLSSSEVSVGFHCEVEVGK